MEAIRHLVAAIGSDWKQILKRERKRPLLLAVLPLGAAAARQTVRIEPFSRDAREPSRARS